MTIFATQKRWVRGLSHAFGEAENQRQKLSAEGARSYFSAAMMTPTSAPIAEWLLPAFTIVRSPLKLDNR